MSIAKSREFPSWPKQMVPGCSNLARVLKLIRRSTRKKSHSWTNQLQSNLKNKKKAAGSVLENQEISLMDFMREILVLPAWFPPHTSIRRPPRDIQQPCNADTRVPWTIQLCVSKTSRVFLLERLRASSQIFQKETKREISRWGDSSAAGRQKLLRCWEIKSCLVASRTKLFWVLWAWQFRYWLCRLCGLCFTEESSSIMIIWQRCWRRVYFQIIPKQSFKFKMPKTLAQQTIFRHYSSANTWYWVKILSN